ncbi:VanZ family protein [Pelagicoccus mobilis]|uniref:VanZ family protein n=1 Tax=Pelagicoccus mobilis TaxID=415221 RepID=A0A934RYC7_9BACT|nr:VanZ family protein [Pelagicoccus mobilis]MBK1878608.1 VanZ family protein [Pelagicoccus mobilis]
MTTIAGPETRYSQRRLWAPAIGVMAVLFVSSHFSGVPAGPKIIGFDKVAHFFVFGLLGTLMFRRIRIRFLEHRRWVWAFAGAMLYALADEVLQFFNPDRSFDVLDWVADAAGAAVAIFVYRNWGWYRRLLEWEIWSRK